MAKFDKRNANEEITQAFIKALESKKEGKWIRPWRSTGSSVMPHNIVSKKPYRGINQLILWLSPYGSQKWGTLKQWASKGYVTPVAYWSKNGKVGDKPHSATSTAIVFWKPIEKTDKEKKDSDGNPVKSKFMLMRTYFVLNAEQMVCAKTGEPYFEPVAPVTDAPEKTETAAHDALNAYCKRESIPVNHGGDSAFYVPSADSITLPPFEAFHSENAYLGTFAHECVHSTGHEKRLNRELRGKYDKNAYAFEELVAEIGATMACVQLGIVQSEEIPDNHTRYVTGWLEIMKGDANAITNAAQLAQKAVDCMLPAEEDTAD